MTKEQSQELAEKLETIKVELRHNYDLEKTHNDLRDWASELEDIKPGFDMYSYLDNIIDYDTAEEMAKRELEEGGLIRLWHFLGNAHLNNDLFKINGYGNLEDLKIRDLENIIDDLKYELKEID